jgi:hypothetical protein
MYYEIFSIRLVLNAVAAWKKEISAPSAESFVYPRPNCFSSWALLMIRDLSTMCHALMIRSPNFWASKLGPM